MDSTKWLISEAWRWFENFLSSWERAVEVSEDNGLLFGDPSYAAILREKISKLSIDSSPLEMLILADHGGEAKEAVEGMKKGFVKMQQDDYGDGQAVLVIHFYQNNRTRRFERNYFLEASYHPKRLAYLMKNTDPYNDHFSIGSVDEYQKKIGADYESLLRNAEVDMLMHPDKRMLDWGIKAKIVVRPICENVDTILQMIDSFQPSHLYFGGGEPANTKETLEQFIKSDQIKTLSALKMNVDMSLFHVFLNVKIPKMILVVDNILNGIGSLLLSFGEEIVQQWERKEREIDVLILHCISNEDIDATFIAQSEVHQVANQIAYGRNGSFNDSKIDSRVKLIRRDDGKGLLIISNEESLLFVDCDYKARRKRGFPDSSALRDLLARMSTFLWDLETIEKEEKFGIKEKQFSEEVIESDIFAIFGDDVWTDPDLENEKDPDENSLEKRKKEVLGKIEEGLKTYIKIRKAVESDRALRIDQLWSDTTEKGESLFVETMNRMVYEPNFINRSLLPDDWTGEYNLLEYVQEYEETGKILPYYEP
ncbi:unnamed protein product, partial [Mesorhabditis belari]|uniref:Uncharacterized protein n=1 Tax=Mesorhabditis belari TaxID=2138241 RepID=A0AAF3ERB6_9BILA